jgi:hypothetical protein
MMFIVRGAGDEPDSAAIRIKAVRKTPAIVPNARGKTDYFCIGQAEAMATLSVKGWEIVELRDGWYEDDAGGGIAISGHGRYWEVRDTPFTVKEAVGTEAETAGPHGEADLVNVRGAIFGV